MASHTFTCINIKNSNRAVWRLTKVSDDTAIVNGRGQLFCLAEISDATDIKIESIKSLVQFIFGLYANAWQQEISSDTQDNLEIILEEANKKFTDISTTVPQGNFSDFSIIIGLLCKQRLFLAQHGKLEAWFLHKSTDKRASHFRLVNILSAKKGGAEKKKLFDIIVSGTLTDDEPFLITTNNLWHYFTQDKIKHFIQKYNTESLATALTETINGLPRPADIALIIAKKDTAAMDSADTTHIALRTASPLQKKSASSEIPAIHQKRYSVPRAKKIGTSIEALIARFGAWIKHLPLKSQVLFIGSVLLLIIFIQTLSWQYGKRQQDSVGTTFTQVYADIQAQLEEAQARLIYNDRNEARQLIEKSLGNAQKLSENTEREKTDKQSLIVQLTNKLNTINNLTDISYLKARVSLTDALPDYKAQSVVGADGMLIVFDDKQTLARVNPETGAVKKISVQGLNSPIRKTAWDDETETLYFLDNEHALWKALVKNANGDTITAEKLAVNITPHGQFTALAFYGDRLYIADSGESTQIKKIDLETLAISDWLTQAEPTLTDIRDSAIDGTIYLINPSSVKQYFKGKPTEWHTSDFAPAPKGLTRIRTSHESDYLYLLEPTQKRFIVLTKEGTLVKQFVSEHWTDIKDVAIDYQQNRAYLLNDNDIFTVELE